MTMPLQKLTSPECVQQLQKLPHWLLDEAQCTITRQFVFSDFIQAFGFITQIAMLAEKHNHHPEWRNVYNKVTVAWTTHDVNGLSTQDILMAGLCDQVFAARAT
jgi:4a-hydroxytetrahydrobiopterin dehydratase